MINNATGKANQPELVKQFSYNLRNNTPGVSQVIQPWMTYNVQGLDTTVLRSDMGNGFIQNRLTPGVEYIHRNHLHVTYSW